MAKHNGFLKSARKNMLLVLALTFVLFISSQFVVMATVSTRGADIGEIRRQQEEIRLENENLRAEISEARTTERIMGSLTEQFDLSQSQAQVININ